MKKIILVLIVALATFTLTGIVSCNSSTKAASAKLLKFNLEKGKGYDYDLVWDMKMGMMGKENNMSVGARFSLNVLEETNKVRTISGTYKSFKMDMDMMGKKMTIDTDKPASSGSGEEDMQMQLVNKTFSGIVGKSFTMKVDEEGNILEVSGFEQLVKGMVDSLDLDEDKKAGMAASLQQQFNEQEIKNQFADMFMIFPNKEVKVGDTWTKSFEKGGKMAANFNTTYTVKEIEGNSVTLSAKTNISADGDTKMTGTQEGALIIDSRTGLMINGDFKQNFEAAIQGFNMTVEGKGKIKGTEN